MEVSLQKNYKYVNHLFMSLTCVWHYIYYSFQLNTFSAFAQQHQLCVIMLQLLSFMNKYQIQTGKVGNSRQKYVSVCWPLVCTLVFGTPAGDSVTPFPLGQYQGQCLISDQLYPFRPTTNCLPARKTGSTVAPPLC